jgi:flagellar hook-basal body complex protein FliE
MADPLGLAGGGGGLGGAGQFAGLRGPAMRPPITQVGAPGAQPKTDGTSGAGTFAKSLLEQIDEVNKLQAEAGQAAEDAVAGRRDDIENVMVGAQKADAAFRMLLSLRNKVQAAYDEIKQVRI